MAKDLQNSEYVKSLSEKRKADPKEFEASKSKYDSAAKQDADTSQPSTMGMLKNLGSSIKDSVMGKKAGGCIKMAKGGMASSRADGCCIKGKTKGRMM